MAHISGSDRSQLLLLPEAVDDYVGADNAVRFIEAFVDGLDLAAAGFARVVPKVTGRPGYDPADLLKLYIYGYLNRVRSSRRLEAETHRNVEVIWLLRHLISADRQPLEVRPPEIRRRVDLIQRHTVIARDPVRTVGMRGAQTVIRAFGSILDRVEQYQIPVEGTYRRITVRTAPRPEIDHITDLSR